ncbi:hypothetical protein PHYBLDRAFT_60467 [Phycomyces blakesleeanus NRRL 1555(-)]|uniref:Uncharacterized protein n=1 Tax=Phycomyces blakesleeanus (strain ATCC 8743b / DSM 1359 / FGSC 10004 / NBRC 33097 / NRRL 1555) TaxID=763407 RepID=A0A167P6E1_PHYB8|nr:hypothetical protein PHYBLDRAFT_60467 [Phycomyces blakesleeanus NRRL 1555(-)]OAD77336.1 hypothetical protein PHYBLDRAFT_60467 [Phycomyces blakesleeanus NRRL 1555(-)]|eukprot:XP_018295376.1 hypothetical protein PHYBLDRAFT_60467 [Phycomyces blakesleeanus NRRL 1555(-)]
MDQIHLVVKFGPLRVFIYALHFSKCRDAVNQERFQDQSVAFKFIFDSLIIKLTQALIQSTLYAVANKVETFVDKEDEDDLLINGRGICVSVLYPNHMRVANRIIRIFDVSTIK